MFPKHAYIRSAALMKAYRQIPCQNCGADDGTVCGAHSNSLSNHKGRGIKADDSKCASLCHACHMDLDQGSKMSREERESTWETCHQKTVMELVSGGLWPAGVAVPG